MLRVRQEQKHRQDIRKVMKGAHEETYYSCSKTFEVHFEKNIHITFLNIFLMFLNTGSRNSALTFRTPCTL